MTPLKPQPSASPLTATTGLLFQPGQVVTTPGALAAMHQHQCLPLALLQRHLSGDWGDVPADDAALNVEALRYGRVSVIDAHTMALNAAQLSQGSLW